MTCSSSSISNVPINLVVGSMLYLRISTLSRNNEPIVSKGVSHTPHYLKDFSASEQLLHSRCLSLICNRKAYRSEDAVQWWDVKSARTRPSSPPASHEGSRNTTHLSYLPPQLVSLPINLIFSPRTPWGYSNHSFSPEKLSVWFLKKGDILCKHGVIIDFLNVLLAYL